MASPGRDPYQTLGVSPGVTDAEIRKAYRQLVQRYHPDHNNGSEESERRFEEVQEAYAKIRELRGAPPSASSSPPRPQASRSQARSRRSPPPPPAFDPDIEARAAALERELKEAQLARERARDEARRAAADAARRAADEAVTRAGPHSTARGTADDLRRGDGSARPSDEELGYIKTDDSFTKILSDARAELSDRFSEAQGHPVVRRVSDLIDELDELASKLTGERPKPGDR